MAAYTLTDTVLKRSVKTGPVFLQKYVNSLRLRLILLDVDVWLIGSGADGAEEIKRHGFFSTIDWNVSV